MLPLRIYEATSRQAFSRQLSCVAQQGPTIGVVKPGDGINMWELSRHGRLVKTLEHHTMQPNALPDVQCSMLAKRPTRRFRRENADVVGNNPMKDDALPKASQL